MLSSSKNKTLQILIALVVELKMGNINFIKTDFPTYFAKNAAPYFPDRGASGHTQALLVGHQFIKRSVHIAFIVCVFRGFLRT